MSEKIKVFKKSAEDIHWEQELAQALFDHAEASNDILYRLVFDRSPEHGLRDKDIEALLEPKNNDVSFFESSKGLSLESQDYSKAFKLHHRLRELELTTGEGQIANVTGDDIAETLYTYKKSHQIFLNRSMPKEAEYAGWRYNNLHTYLCSMMKGVKLKEYPQSILN